MAPQLGQLMKALARTATKRCRQSHGRVSDWLCDARGAVTMSPSRIWGKALGLLARGRLLAPLGALSSALHRIARSAVSCMMNIAGQGLAQLAALRGSACTSTSSAIFHEEGNTNAAAPSKVHTAPCNHNGYDNINYIPTYINQPSASHLSIDCAFPDLSSQLHHSGQSTAAKRQHSTPKMTHQPFSKYASAYGPQHASHFSLRLRAFLRSSTMSSKSILLFSKPGQKSIMA